MSCLANAVKSFIRHIAVMTTSSLSFAATAETDEYDSDNDFNDTIHLENLEIHAILSEQFHLPPEVTELILDYMENWLSIGPFGFESPSDGFIRVRGENKAIVETPGLDAQVVRNLRKVVISLTSKDQGWSSYPEYNGSFDGSHSWWNLGTERLGQKSAFSEQDSVQTASKPSTETDSEAPGESPCSTWTLVKEIPIQYNRHAKKELESYVIELDGDHELLESFRPGDRMVLSACACYPGWVNYVKQAELKIWFKRNLV